MTQTILITGASSGIGKALAENYAKQNWNLILVANQEKQLQEVAQELDQISSGQVMAICQDLRQTDATKQVFEEVTTSGLTLDILVNNAGFGDHGAFAQSHLDKQVAMIAVNNTALISLTHYFLPSMIAKPQQTYVVNLCSTAAFYPGPYMSIYHATKAFVLSFGLALTEELRDTKVAVKTICPGPTATGFQASAGESSKSLFNSMKNNSPEDIATFIVAEMDKKKLVSVQGWRDKAFASMSRLAPRKLSLKIIRDIMTKH